jgi:hypothetical protein
MARHCGRSAESDRHPIHHQGSSGDNDRIRTRERRCPRQARLHHDLDGMQVELACRWKVSGWECGRTVNWTPLSILQRAIHPRHIAHRVARVPNAAPGTSGGILSRLRNYAEGRGNDKADGRCGACANKVL